jgi:hypothetical protein
MRNGDNNDVAGEKEGDGKRGKSDENGNKEGNGNGSKGNGNSDKEGKGGEGEGNGNGSKSNGDGNKEGNGEGGKSNGNGVKEGDGKSGKSNGNGVEEGVDGGGKSNGNGNEEGKGKGGNGNSNKGVRGGTQRQQRGQWQQQQVWGATKRALATEIAIVTVTKVAGNKRAMARAARAMVTATKREMATNGNNTGNGYGKEGGARLTVATRGMVQRTRPLALQLESRG